LALFVGSMVVTVWSASWLFRSATRLPVGFFEALAATVVLLLAARTLASGRARARRFASEERLRERRAILYASLVQTWGSVLGDEDRRADPREQRYGKDQALWSLEQQLALTGSSRVLRRYAALQEHGTSPGPEADALLGKLVAAMRQDLLEPTSRALAGSLARLAKSNG
jgi:hypothetical protein